MIVKESLSCFQTTDEEGAPSKRLASVVRRVDSAIQWINRLVLLVFIRWIVIYPVDSVIHLLNRRGLVHILDSPAQILILLYHSSAILRRTVSSNVSFGDRVEYIR